MSVEYYEEALRNAIARKSASVCQPGRDPQLLQDEVDMARELYEDARKKRTGEGDTE